MRKTFLSAALALSILATQGYGDTPSIGVVNFASCITDSKYGKKEKENLESLQKQMSSLMENTEKELKELVMKCEDTEYVDSLSPKAEEEMRMKAQALQGDLERYREQFYQVLNHANYQMIQKMATFISSAAELVAKEKNLDYVMNKEACLYIRGDKDVTGSVIQQMDKNYVSDVKAKKITENGEALSEGERSEVVAEADKAQ